MSLPLQVWPSPENPGKQLQVKDPKLFVHDAFKLHEWMLAVHSSVSWIKEKKRIIKLTFRNLFGGMSVLLLQLQLLQSETGIQGLPR